MNKRLYILQKINDCGCVYDKQLYDNFKDAWNDFRKKDHLLVCNYDDVYYGDNWQGWCVASDGVIREYYHICGKLIKKGCKK